EADGLARALGDQHRVARIATFMVSQYLATGDYALAVRFGQEALRIAPTLPDPSVVMARWTERIEAVTNFSLGITHIARCAVGQATALSKRNSALEGDRPEPPGPSSIISPITRASLADVLSQFGRFDEAAHHADIGVQLAEAAALPFALYWALFTLGLVHLR